MSLFRFVRSYATIENINLQRILQQVTSDKFTKKFVRSSGPGGQNVNKINTKVELRFTVGEASWLPEVIRRKLLLQEKSSINKDGELVITSERHRKQYRNLEDCLVKVKDMISKAAYVPDPPSQESITRAAANIAKRNEMRLVEKKYKSFKKRDRKNIE